MKLLEFITPENVALLDNKSCNFDVNERKRSQRLFSMVLHLHLRAQLCFTERAEESLRNFEVMHRE